MKKFLLLLTLCACEPPPIKEGKCRIESYDGRDILRRTCIYQGYNWDCLKNTCTRGAEAVGEAPK